MNELLSLALKVHAIWIATGACQLGISPVTQ
jgi:hypothetical protein